eukprot:gene44071-50244_t
MCKKPSAFPERLGRLLLFVHEHLLDGCKVNPALNRVWGTIEELGQTVLHIDCGHQWERARKYPRVTKLLDTVGWLIHWILASEIRLKYMEGISDDDALALKEKIGWRWSQSWRDSLDSLFTHLGAIKTVTTKEITQVRAARATFKEESERQKGWRKGQKLRMKKAIAMQDAAKKLKQGDEGKVTAVHKGKPTVAFKSAEGTAVEWSESEGEEFFEVLDQALPKAEQDRAQFESKLVDVDNVFKSVADMFFLAGLHGTLSIATSCQKFSQYQLMSFKEHRKALQLAEDGLTEEALGGSPGWPQQVKRGQVAPRCRGA